MKLKKLFTMSIAAIMAVSAMSISAFAVDEDSEIVYSYVDKDNNEVNLTCADLEAGHWDKNALGDLIPMAYEDFPMLIEDFIDDYSDLRLDLTYLKKLDDADSVSFTLTDLNDDSVVYTSNISKSVFSIPNIEMNKTYKLTISETFDGVTKEHYKAMTTSVEEAEMPEYVKDAETTDETIILVGDVDNLRASTFINEEGETEIDMDMPRYTQVKACDLADYTANLPTNKLYRVYTRDSEDNRYFGFISTRGDIDGIFMPGVTLHNWERFNSPMPYTSISDFSPEDIRDGVTTPMTGYRDYEFGFAGEDRDYEIFKFTIPEEQDSNNWYKIRAYANDSFTMEVWTKTNNVLKYRDNYHSTNDFVGQDMEFTFRDGTQYESLTTGDEIYFVIHFDYSQITYGEGFISLQCIDDTDDVTGSAYEAYQEWEKGNYTQYKSYTPFYITNDRDVDVFFLNCGTSSVKNYVRVNKVHEDTMAGYNNQYTQRSKYVELAHTPTNATVFRTMTSPDDIMILDCNAESGMGIISFSETSTTTNKLFVYISNAPGNRKPSNDIYLLKRYNK